MPLRVETLLPLGKVDPAQATTTLDLGTAVAIAFARSPTVTALSAWTLAELSGGRFTLGLGSQIRAHVVRRYGMPWPAPAPRMREYVQAVRAVWDCWQHQSRLEFHGEHYDLDLTVPLFDAGPIEHPDIPIHLAAVNPHVCAVAGEVADGVRPHPVCTPSYIREVMVPALHRGAERAGRALPDDFRIAMKPLVATARTDEELVGRVRDARARIAFYASTPGYRAAFDHLGLDDLATEAATLSKARRWEELPALVDDDTLARFAVIGTHDVVAERLRERFDGVVTDIEFSVVVTDDTDRETLAGIARTFPGRSAT